MFRKLVCLCMFLLNPLVFFADSSSHQSEEKTYVRLDELIFDSNGIWLRNGQGPLDAVHFDGSSYYIAKKKQQGECPWRCPKCGTINNTPYPGWGCKECSFPYDGSLNR